MKHFAYKMCGSILNALSTSDLDEMIRKDIPEK